MNSSVTLERKKWVTPMGYPFFNAGVCLADGVITECGTHEALLKTDDIYAQLYKTQTGLKK